VKITKINQQIKTHQKQIAASCSKVSHSVSRYIPKMQQPGSLLSSNQPVPYEETRVNREPFRDFIYRTLLTFMPVEMATALIADEPLNLYFRRAFTHSSWLINVASRDGKYDWEVFEKVGDGVLKGCFLLWLYDIMGAEVTVPQPYADMEKWFTEKEYLASLTEKLGFDQYIDAVNDGNKVNSSMKEDVFEAFIGALTLAADKYIMQDIGMSLAKRWIYQVYNTYVRDEIDPQNSSKYVNYRTRVNDIWLFNGWESAIYITTGAGAGAREIGVKGLAAVNLMGPVSSNFPQDLQGKILSSGRGATLPEAREEAAKNALDFLEVNYPDLKGLEYEFNALETSRLEKLLANRPDILKPLLEVLRRKKDVYESLAIRQLRTYGSFTAQLRLRIDGIWRNGGRGKSRKSKEEALENLFSYFLSKSQ
jgi:dsRNA-specific ribonuclease